MSIPSKTTAYSTTVTDKQIIVDAANAKFIAETEVTIATAITLGQFEVYLLTPVDVDPKYVQDYFTGLGYMVGFPDSLTINGQPAQMFGSIWDMFWKGTGIPTLKSPTRVIISWKLPNP